MKTLDKLLSELRQEEINLWVEGDRLRYRAAKNTLTPQRLAQLKEHKAEIISFLKQAKEVSSSQLPPIKPVDRTQPLPLSFAQQRFWFLHQFEPNNSANNMPVVVRFTGSLNIEALEKSLQEVVRRHEVLRTTFPEVEGQSTQVIAVDVSLTLPVINLQELPLEQREAKAFQIATQEAHLPFDLANGPILRVKLLRLSEGEYLLVWNMHCMVCDGASSDVFYQDLTALYAAFSAGKPSPLPPLPVQYADFSHWQRQWLQGEVLESQIQYWQQKLKGDLHNIELPYDHPRPLGVKTYRGDRAARMLPKTLNYALTNLSQQLGSTQFMTLLAAFEVLLYRYSHQEDMVISFASAGRGQVETERLIGFFSNTLILRTKVEGNLTFQSFLERVRQECLEAYTHQDLPFEKLVEELPPEQSQNRSPLFQVKFALNPPWSNGRGMASVALPDLTITSLFGYIYHGQTKYDLIMVMREQDEGLGMVFDYNADLFDASTMNRMLGHFETLLEGIVANPHQPISELPFLTTGEREQFLVGLNHTQTHYPKDVCIHQLFEAQVQKTPDAVAVIGDQEQLTYGELNTKANQLAHHLQALGVDSDTLVGIYVESSLEMIVGLLGILKAGVAYVPIDPHDEQEHLSLILEDAQVSVILTQQSLLEKLPQQDISVVCLDTGWDAIALKSQENPSSQMTPNNLAYVMYGTESAEGIRGVRIAHQSVVSLVKEAEYAHLGTEEVFLQLASIVCDISTFEIWGCLLNGGRLILSSSPTLEELGKTIQQHQITTLWLPVRLFHRLVDEQFETLKSVRQLLTGNDVLSASHVQKFLDKPGDCKLINCYSMTENTALTCCNAIAEPSQIKTIVPIGKPMANSQVYLLDSHLQPVPVGVPGELYIGGDRLAQGYHHRPDLTQEKFIPSPFDQSKLYKTGDLARYLPDGNLEFLGRADAQVRIRDVGIELRKIETTIGQYPAVRESVVIVREDLPQDECLVAYVVPKPAQGISISELHSFLRQKLPIEMVPSALVILDALPLKSNGKVNYDDLPTPEHIGQKLQDKGVEPRDELELHLTNIWEKVLGIEQIGVTDNFFDLGGQSLIAVRLFAAMEQELGRKLPLSTLLEAPTIEQLANKLRQSEQSEPWDSLVLLKPGNSQKKPLFLIHDADGKVILYLNLARHLETDRPVYGIRPYGTEQYPILHTRVTDMVAHYIEKIRSIQPEGPYLLGGLCVGGNLAFEIAVQLQSQGQKVDLVALIESVDFQLPFNHQTTQARLERFSKILDQSPDIKGIERLTTIFNKAQAKVKSVIRYEVNSKVERLTNNIKLRLFRYYLDNGWPLPQFLQNISVRRMLKFDVPQSYTQKVYQGKLALFQASETIIEDEPGIDDTPVIQLTDDPLFGWNEQATEGVEVYKLPGGHSSILREPYIQLLAEKMQDWFKDC